MHEIEVTGREFDLYPDDGTTMKVIKTKSIKRPVRLNSKLSN